VSSYRGQFNRIIQTSSYDALLRKLRLKGENFGNDADDNVVRINDLPVHFEKYVTDRARRATAADCQEQFPCLVGNRRRMQIFGLSLAKQPFYRPMNVSVQVDSLISGDQSLLLSWASRSTPALIAFGALGILSVIVYVLARGKAKRYQPANKWYHTIAYLFIEPESNTYSLSRLQLILFLPLMGVSAGGYLAGKFVRKPGPVIKQLDPPPPYPTGVPLPAGIRIVGANLSPRAQVALNGVPITSGDVTVPPPQSAAAEFVTELLVTPAAAAGAVAASPAPPAGAAAPAAPGAGAVTGVPSVKVVNPDGQGAEL